MSETHRELLRRAWQHHREGRFDEAERDYLALAESSEDGDPEAWYRLGVLHQERGRFDDALRCLSEAAPQEPELARYQVHLGWILNVAGRFADAELALRRGLQLDPSLEKTYELLVQALVGQARTDEALGLARESVRLHPQSQSAGLLLADLLEQQGELHRALDYYEELLARSANDADLHRRLAKCLARLQDLDAAEAHAREAVRLAGDRAQHQNNLGVILGLKGDVRGAADAFRRAVNFEPDNVHFAANLANALVALGKHEEAIGHWASVIRQLPSDCEAHLNLARSLRAIGRFEEAIASCGQAIGLFPDSALAWNELGVMLEAQGNVEKATTAFSRAVEHDPRAAVLHYNLGAAVYRTGDTVSAERAFKHALALEPDLRPCRSALAQILWRRRASRGESRLKESNQTRPWRGESLAGKTIVLLAERLLTDTLYFARHVRQLKRAGARVVLRGPREIGRLMRQIEGLDLFVSSDEPCEAGEFHAPLGSVGQWLATDRCDAPVASPYVAVPTDRMMHWKKSLGNERGLRIGICWRSADGVTASGLPLDALLALNEQDCLHLFALDPLSDHEREVLPEERKPFELAAQVADLLDLATAITQLDLVVGCDAVPTHLAGALGVPTCVLVTHRFDARALDEQQPTAWYPTMRVLRQQVPGDWSAELERVRAGVRKLACAATT